MIEKDFSEKSKNVEIVGLSSASGYLRKSDEDIKKLAIDLLAILHAKLNLHQSAPNCSRLLTVLEWAKIMPPLVSIKVDYPQWTSTEYDIGLKYALRIATGWVYFANKRYVFEKVEDYMVFKLWLSEDPMIGKDIEIT